MCFACAWTSCKWCHKVFTLFFQHIVSIRIIYFICSNNSFYWSAVFHCMNIPQCIYLAIDEHLVCFHFRVVNKATMNRLTHAFWWTYTLISLGCVTKNRISGSQYNIGRYHSIVFQSSCISLYSWDQYMSAPLVPYPCQVFSVLHSKCVILGSYSPPSLGLRIPIWEMYLKSAAPLMSVLMATNCVVYLSRPSLSTFAL